MTQETEDPLHLPAPPKGATDRIRARVAPDLRPRRGLSLSVRLLVTALASTAAVVAGASMAQGAAVASVGSLAIIALYFVAITVAVAAGVARTTTTPIRRRYLVAAMSPIAFAAAVVLARVFHVHDSHAAAVPGTFAGCLMRGALLTSFPLLVLIAVWRRTDPFTPRISGAIVGGWAGLAGGVALTLACPVQDLVHIAVAHGGAVIGGSLVGAALAGRWLSP